MKDQNIREREQNYQHYYLNAQVALFSSRPSNSELIDCNELFAELVGCTSRQECLDNFSATQNYANSEDRELIFQELKQNGVLKNVKIQAKKIDGTSLWLSYSARLIEGEDRIEGSVIDITTQKNIEYALKESEDRLKSIVNALPDITFILSKEGKYLKVLVSKESERLLYHRSSNLKGKNIRDVLPPKVAKKVQDTINKTLLSRKQQILYFSLPIEGQEVFFEARTSPMKSMDSVVWVTHDITDQVISKQKLKESEEIYRDLVENINEIIFTIDLKGNFTFISNAVKSVAGYTPEEVLGKSFTQFVHSEDLLVITDQFKRILNGNEKGSEYRITNHQGEILWVSSKSSAIYRNGEIVGLRGVMADITARKQAELALKNSEEEFSSLVDIINEGIVINNENFEVIYANKAVCETMGYSYEELINKNIASFFSNNSFSTIIKNREKVIKGEVVSYEVEVIKKDGTALNTLLSGTPVMQNGKFKKSINIFTDITNLKQQERILELKVKERTKDLEITKTKAEIANKAKTEFLGNMSHELRTPIHHIYNYSKFCMEKPDKPRQKRIEYCTIINNSAQKMLTLVDDLLDLSNLETDSVAYYIQSNSMTYVFNNIKTDFSRKLLEKKMSIELPEVSPFIRFDFSQMRKVIKSIIENAIKYGKTGSIIKVDYAESDEKFCVSISNEGKVIPEVERESIFDLFIQSSVTKTGAGGKGLGLSICRRIIEDHGGKIWAEGNPKGATISFCLPK